MGAKQKRLGEILFEAGYITRDQCDEALLIAKEKKNLLGETLVELGYLDKNALYQGLEKLLHIPYIDLTAFAIDQEAFETISVNLAKKHNIIAIRKEGNVLTVAMSDPHNFYALDEIRNATGLEISVVMSPQQEITAAIDRFYVSGISGKGLGNPLQQPDASAAKMIESLLCDAIKSNATDVHIEPTMDGLIVRFRIDGQLRDVLTSSISAYLDLCREVKLMSGMDVGENRLPQTGRSETVADESNVDLHVFLIPTQYGEKIVIHILGGQTAVHDRKQLGISDTNMALIDHLIHRPQGMILVSGPKGSGKTTMLYTLLQEMNTPEINIITIEDLVESRLERVNQVQINETIGLTYAKCLGSILHLDPDLIMIDEIRDFETAELAVNAALTGHLVLSAFHAKDTASSLVRLMDMGLQSYLVSSSITGVIAQRLVRCICPNCKSSYRASHDEMFGLRLKEPVSLYIGAGCPSCNFTGYQGRIGIHEVLLVTKEMRALINHEASADQLTALAVKQGTTSLKQSCMELVLRGITTFDEFVRVTYSVD